jgi:hypothetical protein
VRELADSAELPVPVQPLLNKADAPDGGDCEET